ncbi:MAG: hypothetical protein ABIQ98_02800 [Sphingomicrobium sp.]
MSAFEQKFQAVGNGALELPELLRLVAEAEANEPRRHAAIICYLSASEGWREAAQLLGGAFVVEAEQTLGDAEETRLSRGKEA